ncbi:hypothetical protein [Anaerostipes rhamnosivorans]|nr:hypothetical protein [Anaerostipes rhamnosivorans]
MGQDEKMEKDSSRRIAVCNASKYYVWLYSQKGREKTSDADD